MHHSLAVLLVLMALNSSFAQLSALWNQSYDQFDDSTVEFVIETMTKDGYIVIGTYKDGSSYQHILLRTEAAGEITWTKKFEDYIHHWDCSAQPSFDGGYILCGGGTDGWLKKCDQFGDEIWMRVYGDENYQFGRNIRKLVAEKKAAGTHEITWNGRDDTGTLVSSGVYLYNMSSDGLRIARKLSLFR